MEELLILVDNEGNRIGYEGKMYTHISGQLHLAFSIFVFDLNSNSVLLQKRASSKYHSGDLWSNSCCSHLKKDELWIEAVKRCLEHELGICIDSSLQIAELPQNNRCHFILRYSSILHLGKFQYFAQFDGLSENEIDHVFLYCLNIQDNIQFNTNEVSEITWVNFSELDKWLTERQNDFTAWFQKAYEIVKSQVGNQYVS